MDFPKEFKSFEECEKFFSDKNAGMFHGDKEVAIRVLSNDSKREEKCIYIVNEDKSLTRDTKPVVPETKPVVPETKPVKETKQESKPDEAANEPEAKADETKTETKPSKKQ